MMRWLIRGAGVSWRIAAGILALALVAALGATANQAFAAKRVETANESMFRLGHVAVECAIAASDGRFGGEGALGGDGIEPNSEFEAGAVSRSDPSWSLEGEELMMGVPRVRTYVLTNKGETAYVRLASRTVLGDLVHVNDDSVTEDDAMSDVGEDASGGGSGWVLASDGFWYRRGPLASGESITVNVSVQVPFSQVWIDALSTGGTGEVVETIEVEAMQARNATIDVDATRPWGESGSVAQAAAPSAEDADSDSSRVEGERR